MRSRLYLAAAVAALLAGSAGVAWPGLAHAQTTAPTKNIYSFPPVEMGADPSSDLAADAAGNLYGLTEVGLSFKGTAFRLVLPAAKGQPFTQQTLYNFDYAVSGTLPEQRPLLDGAGNVYGIARVGGPGGQGTVWKLSPPVAAGGQWTLQVLHSFSNPGNRGPGGANPASGLAMDRSGTLYGTTGQGGTYGDGVVFSLTPPTAGSTIWTETVLHNFAGGDDGIGPVGDPLTLSHDENALFGVSGLGGSSGSGLVYRLRRDASAWTYAVVHRFHSVNDSAAGYLPVGALVVDRDNNLFGVTVDGGAGPDCGCGTVFELSPPASGQTTWTEHVLHDFAGPDGALPEAGLVAGGLPTALFGTASLGGTGGAADGSSGNDGVVFRLDPPASGSGPWTYTVLHAFDLGPPGRYKYKGQAGLIGNGLTFGLHRFLFGVATYGGLYGYGTVFAQSPHTGSAP